MENIKKTIAAEYGSYWWSDEGRSGGERPAPCNGPLGTYVLNGQVFSLEIERESGWAGGSCRWWIVPASPRFARKIKDLMGGRNRPDRTIVGQYD